MKSKVKDLPLPDLRQAATGDWLHWRSTTEDIHHAIPNNRAHCVGANGIRRELDLPENAPVRVKYDRVHFTKDNLNYTAKLDEQSVDRAVALDRIAVEDGDVKARLAQTPGEWKMRLISVRQKKVLTQSRLDQMKEINRQRPYAARKRSDSSYSRYQIQEEANG
jgi:hypothetical protein